MSVTSSGATRAPSSSAQAPSRPPSDASPTLGPPEAVAIGILIVAGVVLRFVTASDLWLDEALSVNVASLPLDQLPDALRQDGHPPLYYALLHGWMGVVGEGDVAVRSLAGLVSVATLPLVWVAGRRIGGPALGWIATVLLAVSPYAIRYGTETRMYSLVMFLVVAGYLLVGDALERPRPVRLVGVAVVSGLLLLTHYWALWLVGATVVLLTWRAVREPEAARRRPAWLTAVAVAAGGLFFVPWLPVFFDQMSSTGTPWASPVRPTTMLAVTMADLGGGGGAELRDAEVFGAMVVVLVLLGVFGRAVDQRRIELDLGTNPQVRAETAVVVLTVAIGLAASWVGSTAYASRYVSVVVPLVVLIAAAGATRFTGRLARGLVVGGVSLLALGLAGYLTTAERTQAGEIVAVVAAEGRADDLVVVCPDQLGPSIERLVPDGVDVVAYPELGPADRVDWRDYEERHAVDPGSVAEEVVTRAGDRTIWLVSSASYRVVDDQCDVLRDQLGKVRPASTLVVESGDDFFEHASLTRFAAP